MNHVLVVIEDICDTCIVEFSRNTSPIEINTLTGEVECQVCGHHGQMGQRELLDMLLNLED